MADLELTAAIEAVKDFSWWNYGLDEVGETKSDDWARELVAEIAPLIAEQVRQATAAPLAALCDNADATGRLIHPGQIRDLLRAGDGTATP